MVSLPAGADSWIGLAEDEILANHGGDTNLHLGRFGIFSDEAILVRFDLCGIASRSISYSATLRLLEGDRAYDSTTDSIDVNALSQDWDENTVSGLNSPHTGKPDITVPASTDLVIEVIAYVDERINQGAENFGFIPQKFGVQHSGQFISREGSGAIPSPEINFAPVPCPHNVTIVWFNPRFYCVARATSLLATARMMHTINP